MTWWHRWVAFTGRPVDSRPLRLVRVLIPLCMLGDLFATAWRGALSSVLYPASLGGLTDTPAGWYLLEGWDWGGPALFLLSLLVLPLIVYGGRTTRLAIVVGVVCSAQLGHMYIPGDRAIDRLMRTVLLLLLFSGASAARPAPRVAAWPADLMRWLLVIVYLQAGIVKLDAKPGFLSLERSDLYEIMCTPMVGRLDPVFWEQLMPLFALGGAVTLVLEFSSFLLLTRWAHWWAAVGALMHIGIAITMELGVFPFGMLALYPVLFWPWTVQVLDRLAPWLPDGWGPPDDAD